MGSKAALAWVTVAGGSCRLGSLCSVPVAPRRSPMSEITGTQQGCLPAQVLPFPLLPFSVMGSLIPARILFQFSNIAFCIYLCFTVTKEGLVFFESFSYLKYKNIIHSLAIVHTIIGLLIAYINMYVSM